MSEIDDRGDAPRHVGRYEILSTIGSGGMAAVYRARMHGTAQVSKLVALKLIHAHLSWEQDFILMFLDEMRVALTMDHRNIVQAFDAGRFEDRYYLVMELVDGCSLRQLLDSHPQPLPLELALFIASELCGALDFAHSFGGATAAPVVHRDVSPGNVLLSRHGDVKLADFGVAKAARQLAVSSADLVKGKLAYMAPEQAVGTVEAASDVFSLGAVLYELLCGEPLRQGASLAEVSRPSPQMSASARRPSIPPETDTLLRRCLAADPAARPTAGSLRRELAQLIFNVQRTRGLGQNLHDELAFFLGGALRAPATADEGPAATRLASAMLQAARAMPTDHGDGLAVFRAPAAPPPPKRARPPAPPAPPGKAPPVPPGEAAVPDVDTERSATHPRPTFADVEGEEEVTLQQDPWDWDDDEPTRRHDPDE